MHPPGTVFQKPYPTGDPDIAGFDDQAPDRRILSAIAGCARRARAARRSGAASTSAGCRPSCGAPTMTTTTSCEYEILYRREGDTEWKIAEVRPDGNDLRLGYDLRAQRHLHRQGGGVRWGVEPAGRGAGRGTRKRGVRHRQHAALSSRSAPRAWCRAARRSSSRCATTGRRSQKVEYSLDAQRWQVIYPKDGIFDSRTEQFELTLDSAAWPPRAHHPRLRRQEQQRHRREMKGSDPLFTENVKRGSDPLTPFFSQTVLP